jgi:hypothetical protein
LPAACPRTSFIRTTACSTLAASAFGPCEAAVPD